MNVNRISLPNYFKSIMLDSFKKINYHSLFSNFDIGSELFSRIPWLSLTIELQNKAASGEKGEESSVGISKKPLLRIF